MEVRYSINGQYFADFGVYVSASKGIADALKRKKVNTYDWAEYHGSSVDLDKPKYEARTIELQCFIVGDNWEIMLANFLKLIRDEFSKPGTQRLLIEPFGYKAMPYEVYMQDDVNVSKEFREGKMHAVFSIKMIEPNPVKKVLHFTGDKLDLSYNCPTETEIFYGNGLKEVAQGNVSLSGKALANRAVSGYGFAGRNIANWGNTETYLGYIDADEGTPQGLTGIAKRFHSTGNANFLRFHGIQSVGTYTVSGWARRPNGASYNIDMLIGDVLLDKITIGGEWAFFKKTFDVQQVTPIYDFLQFKTGSEWVDVSFFNVSLKKGTSADYSSAPEDEKYIILAGNVEEITNLQSNAVVLWERL